MRESGVAFLAMTMPASESLAWEERKGGPNRPPTPEGRDEGPGARAESAAGSAKSAESDAESGDWRAKAPRKGLAPKVPKGEPYVLNCNPPGRSGIRDFEVVHEQEP